MSERIDRRIGSNRLLLGALLAIFAVAALAGVFVWMRLSEPASSSAVQARKPAVPFARPDEPLTVTLYCTADGMLSTGTAAVRRKPDAQAQAREVLAALAADPRSAQSGMFKEMKIRGFFVDSTGTAYVDLSPSQQNDYRASAWAELLAIYAIVDTLTQNFEEIKQVRFLLEGKEAQTLAGHIDLTRKFEKRMDLVRQQ